MAALFCASAATPLALALLSQYGFGLHPCELCLWQRGPYVALIAAGVVALIWPQKLRVLLRAGFVLWLIEALLAMYHVGVEQHWWQSATGCSAGGQVSTLDDLRAQIMEAPLVACDQPEFIFAGLSMAAWNVLYSLAMLLFLIFFRQIFTRQGEQ